MQLPWKRRGGKEKERREENAQRGRAGGRAKSFKKLEKTVAAESLDSVQPLPQILILNKKFRQR